jgi:hypothetical protein
MVEIPRPFEAGRHRPLYQKAACPGPNATAGRLSKRRMEMEEYSNNLIPFLIFVALCLLAAIDSHILQMSKYEGSCSTAPPPATLYKGYNGPVITFIGCFLLPLIFFPWHLVRRCQIASGKAVMNK